MATKTNRPKTSLQLTRERQGRTREECAKGLRVNVNTWKRWEIGYAVPNAASLLDISTFLGVPAEHFRDITQSNDRRRGRRPTGPGQSVQEDPT